MAQTVNQLSATKVQKIKAPGMYPDGAGLYLQVTGEAAKSWVLRYSLRGKAREMGLGSLRKVSLADARRKAADCHRLLDDHIDPIGHRTQVRASAALANAKSITFKEAASRYVAMRRTGLKNAKHAAQWGTTIATYAEPVLGKLLVRDIDVGHVHRVLEPIWTSKAETAGRVRGRIEKILGWAKVNNYRAGENPARWRDNLDNMLPKLSEVRKVKHHPALPYAELPEFMEKLRQEKGSAARALEFLILTAARTEEVMLARPDEIDKRARLWTAPAEHMKLKRAHLVPLSNRAMQLLDGAGDSYLFPSPSHPDKHLSNMAMLMVLAVLREQAMASAKTKKPTGKRYNNEFGDLLQIHGFDDIDKSDRAKLFLLMEDLSQVETWRAWLSHTERQRLNQPSAVYRAWMCPDRGGRWRREQNAAGQNAGGAQVPVADIGQANEAPAPKSYSVAQELQAHPGRAELIRNNPNVPEREAGERLKEPLQVDEAGQRRKMQELFFRRVVRHANEVLSDAEFLDGKVEQEVLQALRESIELTQLPTLREAGAALIRLADYFKQLANGEAPNEQLPAKAVE